MYLRKLNKKLKTRNKNRVVWSLNQGPSGFQADALASRKQAMIWLAKYVALSTANKTCMNAE